MKTPIITILAIAQFALIIIGYIKLWQAKATKGPKILWAFIIPIFNFIGPISFLLFGRKKETDLYK